MKQDRISAVKRSGFADPVRQAMLHQSMLSAGVGAWECDLRDDRLTWTDGVYDLFGIRRGADIGRDETVAMYAEESRSEMQRLRAEAIANQGRFRMDARIFTASGEERWMRLTAQVLSQDGRPVRIHGLKQDITEERTRWEHVRRLAESDPLTGLSSRAMFEEQFLHARVTRPLAALILVDMDGLKRINDLSGHLAGDVCIRHVGTILRESLKHGMQAMRIGGDEFAVLIDPPCEKAEVVAFVRKLREALSRPASWNGRLVDVSASKGIAMPADPLQYDPQHLFADADKALYQAKRSGRNAARLFVPSAF